MGLFSALTEEVQDCVAIRASVADEVELRDKECMSVSFNYVCSYDPAEPTHLCITNGGIIYLRMTFLSINILSLNTVVYLKSKWHYSSVMMFWEKRSNLLVGEIINIIHSILPQVCQYITYTGTHSLNILNWNNQHTICILHMCRFLSELLQRDNWTFDPKLPPSANSYNNYSVEC